MRGIPGISDVNACSSRPDLPQIEVETEPGRSTSGGPDPGDDPPAASALMASEEVGDIFRPRQAYDVNVRRPHHTGQHHRRERTC